MADPAISVIVPVFRDWNFVPQLLEALARQDLADFEVILVDNDAAANPPVSDIPKGRVLHCTALGSYAARNMGAAAARGAILAFTDADCRPLPGWLSQLCRDDLALRAGPVRIVPNRNPNRWEVFDTVRGIPQDRFISRNYAVTANLSLPATLFRQLGGFDASRLSGGDAEFCRRAVAQGHPLIYVPAAGVDHPARNSREMLATKARRVKGGQVAAGSALRRIVWTIRTLTPPLREISAYLASSHPWRWRLTASAVRMELWGVELAETARLLLLRTRPERR